MTKSIATQRTVSALPMPWMVIPALITGIVITIILSAILIQNDFFFTYTLDDPYIHLALAENIARGHYGVNENEFSSPSSSIIWPFLLAMFGAHPFAPLVINILVTIGIALLLPRTVQIALDLTDTKKDHTIILFLSLLLIFTTNIIGLVFTGMEHSLQVFCTLLIAHGLIGYARYQQLPRWMPVALILAPLVRYENLAISLLAAIFLITQGKRWLGFVVIAFIGILVGGFSLFLMSLELSPLPASVIVKSKVELDQSEMFNITLNIMITLYTKPGITLSFLLLIIITSVFLSIIDTSRKPLALITVLAAVAHIMFGRYGWFSRYEIYILLFVLIMMLYLFAPRIIDLSRSHKPLNIALLLILWSGFLGTQYISPLFSTPLAAANIYQQQYQMHRFVTEFYQKPVAVNDIGYVSYQNDRYVLDLWGLSSYETLLRYYEQPDWLEIIVNDYDIDFVILYEEEFNIPRNWIKLGELHLGVPLVSTGEAQVSFYASHESAIGEIYAALQRFVPTLPGNAKFIFTYTP